MKNSMKWLCIIVIVILAIESIFFGMYIWKDKHSHTNIPDAIEPSPTYESNPIETEPPKEVDNKEYYKDHFLPNTYIYDINCSNLTLEQVEELYMNKYLSYPKVVYLGDNSFEITEDMFDLSWKEIISRYLSQQDIENWDKNKEYRIESVFDINDSLESMLSYIMKTWDIFDKDTWENSEDASFILNETHFEIVPEKIGTTLDLDVARELVRNQLLGEKVHDTSAAYEIPEITSKSEELIKIVNELNSILDRTITFTSYGETYILDGTLIQKFLEVDYDSWVYTFDYEGLIDNFISELSKELNTLKNGSKFVTHEGEEVIVSGGNWGNDLNIKKVKEELVNIFENSDEKEVKGTLYWNEVHDPDINKGNYVEVDLENQKIYLYVDGEEIGSSSVVTGNVANGNATPPGVFKYWYKTTNATLRGPGYSCFVSYWMPFNGGIGLHDATWRSSFGGNIYQKNGSHGCVNMPVYMAELIYKYLDESFVIVCHN